MTVKRQDHINQLRDGKFDVIVIGGGATGAGVARDATLRGLKVALLEKTDFGSGTSMHSTKLLHGGLRYLKNYEFGLVREAALERHVHLKIAPHLCEVLDFMVPLHTWSEDKPWLLRLGMIFYDLLAFPRGIGRHRYLSGKELVKLEPLLENPDLKSGGVYQDVRTDDARLVLANILSAIDRGAVVTNYTEVIKWEKIGNGVKVSIKDLETQEELVCYGRSLVICSGPWTQIVEERGSSLDTRLRLTWGAHILVKQRLDRHPILMMNDDRRPVFVIPRDGYDLAGTTDIDYEGDPDAIKPTKEDVDYILKALNRIFPDGDYSYEDVISAYSGLRPLVYQNKGSTAKISRNHEIFSDNERVVTIAGGKLTTYRVMAKEGIDLVMSLLGRRDKGHPSTKESPLWGGDIEDWDVFVQSQQRELSTSYGLEQLTSRLLCRWYGSQITRFREVLDEVGTETLKPDRPWLKAQVVYATRFEYARHPIDVLRRRTPIMLEENNGEDILDQVIDLMAQDLGWTAEEKNKKRSETLEYINSFIRVNLK